MTARFSLFSIFLLAATSVSANCGSSYCSINTNSEVHFDAPDPGLSVNLHYELVDLHELRAGKNKAASQGEPGGHDELETINHNLVLAFDYVVVPAKTPQVRRRNGLRLKLLA